MSSTPFGEHLKRERELRGVSLDEISAATRIKTSFLEALENGRWSELPGGAFNRGFVRATARFLGLDEDGMVAEYALETGGESQTKLQAQPSGAMPRDYRPAIIAAVALLLLLVAGGWFAHHALAVRRQKRAAAAAAAAAAMAATAQPAAPASAPPAPGATSADSAANAAPGTSANSAPVAPAAATPVAASDPAATEPLKLRLETTKTVRIAVTADGEMVFKGQLHSDDPKNFEAADSFDIASSDPGAVKLQLNGKSVAFHGSGRHGNSISLSRDDLKPSKDLKR
jgi:cytoskeletal protein RodZ